MKTNALITVFILSFISPLCMGQDMEYNEPNTNNPLVPGYFADPTLVKFGDTFYVYATTDGVRLASGEPQVWMSKDFVNWYNQGFEIPFGLSNIWAPDIVIGPDGKYYYFHGNCELAGCAIFGYSSESPTGPWTNIVEEGEPVIPNALIGDLPSLDQHYFFDDDGSLYSYFGTWISSFDGLGWAEIDPDDMHTILDKGQIPMDQLPEIFEAPFMLKKNDKYIMMYSSGSCHDETYRVQYSYGDSPTGPFTHGENNPILETTEDGTVHGPGHHSVFEYEGEYYIAYHRHDNPHSTGGMFRQVCVDKLIFENDSTIKKVEPTHEGIGKLAPEQITQPNLAFKSSASASSSYHIPDSTFVEAFEYERQPGYSAHNENEDGYTYYPDYAVDNNNGTMWRSGTNHLPQHITIDLGSVQNIKRVKTNFEYATYYYQYQIEHSTDSLNWEVYADRTDNREQGSPMIDDGDVNARYLRITVTGTEKAGLFAAIWNIRVFDELFEVPDITPVVSEEGPAPESTKSLLVELDAKDPEKGEIKEPIPNTGTLGGKFKETGNPEVEEIYNVNAITFHGDNYLTLSEKTPPSLSWNSPFTVSAWVYNPDIGSAECIVSWSEREGNLMGEFAALMYGTDQRHGAVIHWTDWLDMPYNEVPEAGKWHHITVTFDGMIEKIYVNGKLDNQEQKNLFVHEENDIIIGSSGAADQYLRGSIASLRMYDKYFPADRIEELMKKDNLDIDYDASASSIEQ